VKEEVASLEERRVDCPTCDATAVLCEKESEAVTLEEFKLVKWSRDVTFDVRCGKENEKDKVRRKFTRDSETLTHVQDEEDVPTVAPRRKIVYVQKYLKNVPNKVADDDEIVHNANIHHAAAAAAVATDVPSVSMKPKTTLIVIPYGYNSVNTKSHSRAAACSADKNDDFVYGEDILHRVVAQSGRTKPMPTTTKGHSGSYASSSSGNNQPTQGIESDDKGKCMYTDNDMPSERQQSLSNIIMGNNRPIIAAGNNDGTVEDEGTMYRHTATLGEDMICKAVQAKNNGKRWLFPREFQLVHALKHVARNRNVRTGVYIDPGAQEYGENRFKDTHILEIRGWLHCIQELANQRQEFSFFTQEREEQYQRRQPLARGGLSSYRGRRGGMMDYGTSTN